MSNTTTPATPATASTAGIYSVVSNDLDQWSFFPDGTVPSGAGWEIYQTGLSLSEAIESIEAEIYID